MRRILFLVLAILSVKSGIVSAQSNVDFTVSNFPAKIVELNKIQKELEQGNKLFNEGPIRYKLALINYEKCQEFNPNNALLNFRIGMCYMYSSFKNKAKPYFENAYKLNPDIDKDIHYWLGLCNHLEMKWDLARAEYEKHKQLVMNGGSQADIKKINKRLEEIKIGEERVKKPVKVKIENLGAEINSPYTDYGPIIDAEEAVLMFTSRRPGTTTDDGVEKDESLDEYWEDIYQSFTFNKKWIKAKNVGRPVNTPGHEATNNFSPDGEKLFIYIDDNGQGDIFECDLVNLEWSKPTRMKEPINTKFHESSATINKRLDTLYFVSERPGGLGGRDIYFAIKDANGKWGNVTNIGSTLNTEYDEEGVFLLPDSKTLYFSSQAHNSMGGFDIYKSTKVNGNWTTPVNLGYPVNTVDDDVFFVMASNGLHGYYASIKNEGFGEKDIYEVTFLSEEESKDSTVAEISQPITIKGVKTANSTLLKGLVADVFTQKPIKNATIEFKDAKTGQVLEKMTNDELNGYYGIWVPSGTTIQIYTTAVSYSPLSDSIKIPPALGNNELVKNLLLKPSNEIITVIKGYVTDAVSGKPLAAELSIADNIANNMVSKVNTNPETGYYEVTVNNGKTYDIIVRSTDYQTGYEEVVVPVSAKNAEIRRDVKLNNLAVGARIILKNIFYDFDKATLRPKSIIELDRLIALLREYPNMRIELSSHTDNKGTPEYNIVLSNNRSKSCVDYLVKKGIPKSRLEYKGYGLTQPIATNDTDEGRQLNRRTEFKILSK